MERKQITGKPLTKEESKILLSFVENSKIIKNKTMNAITNKLKKEEWKRIAKQFNAVVSSCYRTPQQLRLKWENLKKSTRKRKTLIKMNNNKTGGGGCPEYIPPDEILDRVAALLDNMVDGTEDGTADGTADKDTEDCLSTEQSESFVSTPRASGSKRKFLFKNDENRAARNKAIAEYYTAKKKLIEANLENALLQNKKLKLELENVERCDKRLVRVRLPLCK